MATQPLTAAQPMLLGFARRLRAEGVKADLHRLTAFFNGLATFDDPDLKALYFTGRLTLCSKCEDTPKYDWVFSEYFLDFIPPAAAPSVPPQVTPAMAGATSVQQKRGGEDDDERETIVGAASDEEVLRRSSLPALTAQEREQVYALIARMTSQVATRRSRRHEGASRPLLDVRRTVRSALAHGGEPDRLYRRRRRSRVRRRIILLDISGSMAGFAGGLMRLAYAALQGAPRLTEVFTLGTRLTRVTAHLRASDSDAAIAAASSVVPDWSGGTRLGDQMKAFLDLWGQRGMARGAIVVVASDGLERGGSDLLGAQMARLRRLARRVIWFNPHKATPGFEPLMAGMRAALPSVHDFVGGDSAADLERLLQLISFTPKR